MTTILAQRSAEQRAAGEALISETDDLACQSWNDRMWSDGGLVDPSPSIDQAINGGYACATTCVHDLVGRLRCEKCREAGKRPAAELLQLCQRCPVGDPS